MDYRGRRDDPEWEPEWEASGSGRRSGGGGASAYSTPAQARGFRSQSAPLHRLSEAAASDEPIICQVPLRLVPCLQQRLWSCAAAAAPVQCAGQSLASLGVRHRAARRIWPCGGHFVIIGS